MATSTPPPAIDPDANVAAPRRETLGTVAAQVEAIDTLLAIAQRSVRVFDVDLSGMGWNGAARAERIGAFLKAGNGATLQIAVHDTGWIERSCPRLVGLLRVYGHALTIRRTGESARHAMDPLVIVDDRHFLHRFDIAQPRAAFAIEMPDEAKPLAGRFDEIWADAEPGVNATVLGL
jgi:hypothetical protein